MNRVSWWRTIWFAVSCESETKHLLGSSYRLYQFYDWWHWCCKGTGDQTFDWRCTKITLHQPLLEEHTRFQRWHRRPLEDVCRRTRDHEPEEEVSDWKYVWRKDILDILSHDSQDSSGRTRQTTSYQDHEIMTARNQQVHWLIQLCQSCRWFSPVSSTNKIDCHEITEILLIVALNTIKPTNQM
jgi:hypothetical protein